MCKLVFQKTQKCVILSTSEAEYVTFLGGNVTVLSFLRQVWLFMLPGKGISCFQILKDNQGAAQRSQNPVSNSNSKQINVCHHFLKELVYQGGISVNHVSSEYQHVDILKALAMCL